MFTLVIGRGKTGKSTYCFRQFADKICEGPGEKPSYFIVPEQYALSAERQILHMPELQGRTLLDDEVLSFKRLAYRILSRLGGLSAHRMDEEGKIMLLTQIAYEARQTLSYYSGLCDNPWQISRVLALFSEFEKYGVQEQMLRTLADKENITPTLSQKLGDLALLYGTFTHKLHKTCMTDGDIFHLAARKAATKGYFKGSCIWVDSFTGFTALERELLIQMMIDCQSLTVTLCMDENGEPIFDGIRVTFQRLIALAKELHVPYQVITLDSLMNDGSFYQAPALRALEKSYTAFRGKVYVPEDGIPEDKGLEIHESRNVFEEITYVARSLNRLHAQGVSYGEMAVAVRHPEEYGSLIEAIFSRYQIPFFMDTRRSIESNPLIVAIIGILNILHGGFRYEDVAMFLKTGMYYTDLALVDALENEILSSNLRGEQRYCGSPCKELQLFGTDFATLKQRLSRCSTLEGCVDALESFMVQHQFRERLEALGDALDSAGKHEKAEEYIRIWDIVMKLFTQIRLFLGNIAISSVKETCALLRKLLSAGFASYRTGFLPQNPEAVQIVGIDRSRTAGLQALFLMGANEGVLPAAMDDSGLLNDGEREWINAMSVELADDSVMRVGKERYMIYATLFAPASFLCVSYPLRDCGGNPMMPSTAVVQQLRRLFPSLPITRWTEHESTGDPSTFARLALLQNDTARNLFLPAERPLISVSRLETYRSCPYRYFLNYGLRAQERDLGEMDLASIGNLMHKLIEKGTASLVASGDVSASDIISSIFDTAVREAGVPSEARESGRGQLIVTRLNRFATSALQGIQQQIDAGRFIPVGFEVPFGKNEPGSLPALTVPIGEEGLPAVRLQGQIDRFDVYAEEDRLYVRVIDYKSSEQKMKFDDVYLGQRLQLMTYMKTLVEQKNSREAVLRMAGAPSNSQVLPAGVLYFVMKDDLSRIDTNGALHEKSYCMEGFLLDEPDVLRAMTGNGTVPVVAVSQKKDGFLHVKSGGMTMAEYRDMSDAVDNAVRITVRSIASGEVTPAPSWTHNGKSPCTYCAYGAVCGIVK